ncbi:MAG TPA: hypothetical protein VIL37_08745 [Natronosporangium sp.]
MIIDRRFNGPPDTGNGGYTAGLVASQLEVAGDEVAEVTLRQPPPLATPLRVVPTGQGIEVYAEREQPVAEARPVRFDEPMVPAVSYDEAVDAAARYPGFADHPFPTCYVCGPQRPDGLRIFPGPLPDGRGTAAPWTVPEDVTAVTVWAALDCPGGWAIIAPGRPYVLGRMAARVLSVPPAGAGCVVVGAVVATEGRKAQVRSTVYGPGGEPLGYARSTWLAI